MNKSGSRCYCGNTLKYPAKIMEKKCMAKCSGDSNQFCGDVMGHYFSVFKTKSTSLLISLSWSANIEKKCI